MDFIDEIKALAATIPRVRDRLKTEEATKLSLVVPFIYRVLGYNVSDPTEVVPELSADFGQAMATKVDYGIYMDNEPVMLFECKWCGQDLQKKDEDQLRKYFAASKSSRLGVVTNGIKYLFFTDLDDANVMDERPFLEFNLLDIKDPLVSELKKFTKANFHPDGLAESTRELRYMKEIKATIDKEFNAPSEDFVKFFAGEVYQGKKIVKKVLDQFTVLTKKALAEYIKEKVDDRLKIAIRVGQEDGSGPQKEEPEQPAIGLPALPTDEEKEAYYIVRAILCQAVNPERIDYRKGKKRFDILLDNSNRNPICRFYLDDEPKEVGLLDANKTETRQVIQQPSEIYRFGEKLKAIANHYLNKTVTNGNHAEVPETLEG